MCVNFNDCDKRLFCLMQWFPWMAASSSVSTAWLRYCSEMTSAPFCVTMVENRRHSRSRNRSHCRRCRTVKMRSEQCFRAVSTVSLLVILNSKHQSVQFCNFFLPNVLNVKANDRIFCWVKEKAYNCLLLVEINSLLAGPKRRQN